MRIRSQKIEEFISNKIMHPFCLDKTLLNLSTILFAGSGLFAVLTKFSVPELNLTIMGGNPYHIKIKREKIEKVMTWIFISLA